MIDLNRFAAEIHSNNVQKGFWEGRSVGDVIALIHSEASEALEEWRDGRPLNEIRASEANKNKPEGFGIELADIIIRVLDACHQYGIDVEMVLELKHHYNMTRPFLHGRAA